MSRSAHAQSTYKLRKLPKCSKCNQEFNLVTSSYEYEDGTSELVDEWECSKCHKIVPYRILKEIFQEQDTILHKWCKNEQQKNRIRNKRK